MITISIFRIPHGSLPKGGFVITFERDEPAQAELCVAALKHYVPSSALEYDENSEQWVVIESATDHVHRWSAYASKNLFAQVEWWSSDDDEPEEDWTPPPPPRQRLMKEDAYKTLFLQPNSPPELVRVVFRYLATVYDPDKDGDEENLKAINAAYKQLTA